MDFEADWDLLLSFIQHKNNEYNYTIDTYIHNMYGP